MSIASKIGCTGETLNEWVKKVEVDAGKRANGHGSEAEGARAGELGASADQRDPAQGFRLFCPSGARPPIQTMIAFIDDHRAVHGVEPICKVLLIAPSTYRDHVAKPADPKKLSARAKRNLTLKPEIERVFAENFEVYGARKVWRQMLRQSFAVARCAVERLIADLRLHGVIRGKPVRTTVQDKAAPPPRDHLNRLFHAPAPSRLWLSAFT